jgi:hypothetical protein
VVVGAVVVASEAVAAASVGLAAEEGSVVVVLEGVFNA